MLHLTIWTSQRLNRSHFFNDCRFQLLLRTVEEVILLEIYQLSPIRLDLWTWKPPLHYSQIRRKQCPNSRNRYSGESASFSCFHTFRPPAMEYWCFPMIMLVGSGRFHIWPMHPCAKLMELMIGLQRNQKMDPSHWEDKAIKSQGPRISLNSYWLCQG